MPESRSVTALAKVEAMRLAKHPMFLIGVVLCAVFMGLSVGEGRDYYNDSITPGFFVGLFSTVTMYRLSRSMDRTEEAVAIAPASRQDRIRALQLACLLPAVLGVIAFTYLILVQSGTEPYSYGGLDGGERFAIFFGNVVLACIGGPLLGVAAGQWLRFPGAAIVLPVGLLFYILLGEGLTVSDRDAAWTTLVRLLSPWTQFTSFETDKLEVWRGNPWWYLGWLVALCVLAFLGALLKAAEGDQRRQIIRIGFVVGIIGLACVALALVTGPDYGTLHDSSGVRRLG
jgi:purine-cytosine permease-like protein